MTIVPIVNLWKCLMLDGQTVVLYLEYKFPGPLNSVRIYGLYLHLSPLLVEQTSEVHLHIASVLYHTVQF